MNEREILEFSHLMPCDSGFLYKWHALPNAFDRLLPAWENVKTKNHPGTLSSDSSVELIVKQGPVGLHWNLQHTDIIPGLQFADEQIKGPFQYWKHVHKMQEINSQHSLLVEHIEFELPIFTKTISELYFKKKLKRLFDFRFKVISNDIRNHYKYKERKAMKVLITGSHGLVGSALYSFLSTGGHKVFRLVRGDAQDTNEISWLPPKDEKDDTHYLDPQDLEGFDAVIHLAGENIADKRWSDEQKSKIYNSRILSTKLLAKTLAGLDNPPKTFICASAIGFYGDRDSETLTENSDPSKCFMGKTCQDWESATKAASDAGIRVVNTRFGIILDPKGGALAKMLPIFSLGGGGTLGDGKQFMSWIALDDVLGGILHCLMNDEISGPVNFVAPNAVRNSEFTREMGRSLKRPAFLPAPAFALRIAMGEMADSLLLSSAKVEPKVLEKTNYEFSYPEIRPALDHMLGS